MDVRSTVSRGALPLCSPIRSHHIWFQWLIIFLDCSQISRSLQVYVTARYQVAYTYNVIKTLTRKEYDYEKMEAEGYGYLLYLFEK